ncbi:MAG: alpha-1,2-fucosyltransferase [Curvibacter sp.]|jgi:hypothetical protein|nr:alpha-1,2-fucosyltransferase [Curvibacter sp.]
MKADQPLVVTFSGGMGAQVISAAIYFAERKQGRVVYADLSYFDKPEDVVLAGQPGHCSHWAWQLGLFGISPAAFESVSVADRRKVEYLADGQEKLERALVALADPAVREHFKVPASIEDLLPGWSDAKFLCIHVRRGDYVNVASHLVSDEAFISLAQRFAGILERVVVLSDSPIGESFRVGIAGLFSSALFLDDIGVDATHRIMRRANALICSNSQFSLIAAALNPGALALIPKQWFGGADRLIEKPLHDRCAFQTLSA